LRYAFVDGLSVPDNRTRPPSYNVAPSQELYVIRHNHKTGERTLDLLRWVGARTLVCIVPIESFLSGEPSKEPEQSNPMLMP
jgi:hypothetical protein